MTSEGRIYNATVLALILSLVHLSNSSSIFSGNSTLRHKRQNCEFPCKDGECVPEDVVCDGIANCKDGSDETMELCSRQTCPPYLFRCNYGPCITKSKVCDGKKDCVDNSDETGSGCRKEPGCAPSQFRCKDGQCISDLEICDGDPTCADGSDETLEACGSSTCASYLYRCAYGACVNKNARCNGKRDCADGSDEAGCPGATVPTSRPPPPPTQAPPIDGGCLLPEHPPNGQFSISGDKKSYTPNTFIASSSSIDLTCNHGYQSQGGTIYCINGGWIGERGLDDQVCLRRCPALTDPTIVATCTTHGIDGNCTEPVEGTVATTRCALFFKDGHGHRRPLMNCVNGQWTPQLGVCTPECGLKRTNAQTLVIGGTPAIHGEYPWIVGIYDAKNVQICGGSIISRKFIISAAHCFADGNGAAYDKSLFTIVAGKHYRPINDPRDTSRTQIRKIAMLYVNEDYRGQLGNYQNDVAIAKVDADFVLSLYVQPVCISDSGDDYDLVDGNSGVVGGWGYTEEGGAPAEELKKVIMPFHTKSVCKANLAQDFYLRYFTQDKFCAGYVNKKTNVCSGDSGGGFYMNNTNRYVIRGIVSLAPSSKVGCDSNNFALFTKVSQFDEWIFTITGGIV